MLCYDYQPAQSGYGPVANQVSRPFKWCKKAFCIGSTNRQVFTPMFSNMFSVCAADQPPMHDQTGWKKGCRIMEWNGERERKKATRKTISKRHHYKIQLNSKNVQKDLFRPTRDIIYNARKNARKHFKTFSIHNFLFLLFSPCWTQSDPHSGSSSFISLYICGKIYFFFFTFSVYFRTLFTIWFSFGTYASYRSYWIGFALRSNGKIVIGQFFFRPFWIDARAIFAKCAPSEKHSFDLNRTENEEGGEGGIGDWMEPRCADTGHCDINCLFLRVREWIGIVYPFASIKMGLLGPPVAHFFFNFFVAPPNTFF